MSDQPNPRAPELSAEERATVERFESKPTAHEAQLRSGSAHLGVTPRAPEPLSHWPAWALAARAELLDRRERQSRYSDPWDRGYIVGINDGIGAIANALPSALPAPEPSAPDDPEFHCDDCGSDTHDTMVCKDVPVPAYVLTRPAPDDLQEQIAVAIAAFWADSDTPEDAATAVMDVLRREGVA